MTVKLDGKGSIRTTMVSEQTQRMRPDIIFRLVMLIALVIYARTHHHTDQS